MCRLTITSVHTLARTLACMSAHTRHCLAFHTKLLRCSNFLFRFKLHYSSALPRQHWLDPCTLPATNGHVIVNPPTATPCKLDILSFSLSYCQCPCALCPLCGHGSAISPFSFCGRDCGSDCGCASDRGCGFASTASSVKTDVRDSSLPIPTKTQQAYSRMPRQL